MTEEMSQDHAEGLRRFREQTMTWRPRKLGPHEGPEAFQQHKLLAVEIQRVALLDKVKGNKPESETDAWVRYMTRCFPNGRNDADDARVLFADWRTSLIKNGAPGPRVVVTHGQAHVHWVQDSSGRRCIDLESMWDDFLSSLDEFMKYLRARPDRRAIVLDRAKRKGTWSVKEFIPRSAAALAGATVMDASFFTVNASAASSVTAGSTPDDPLTRRPKSTS